MVGILSMMFMVIFASLAVAMAIVSQGNLQTAQTQLRVNNAIGAVDTGLAIASWRLRQAAAQLRVERGEVTPDFAMNLWSGPPYSGGQVLTAQGNPATTGVRGLLAGLHATDTTTSISLDYIAQSSWLATDPIVLETSGDNQPVTAAQITYIPLPAQGAVRTVVTGYAWDWTSQRWISRTAQQDFRIFKRVDQAILGPSKIMIGKNVQINGPIGARFDGVDHPNGHPIIMKSDFIGLDPVLDQKIRDLQDAILQYDVNGDNRLRVNHAIESQGLSSLNSTDYSGDGQPDNAFADATGDGAVDEFDVFINHYSSAGDGRVYLWQEMRNGGPYENSSRVDFPEGIDDDLARLIDWGKPDRNGDGSIGGPQDTALGWADGVIDARDRYAKIHGRVLIRANRSDWEAQDMGFGEALEHFQKVMEGPIRPENGESPITFDASDELLPEINTETFTTENSPLIAAASGAPFASQAGVTGELFTLVTNADGVVVGQSYNPSIPTVIEGMPWGGGAIADYYERPVFENIVFKDVVIPKGLNALFINCTFAGVTRVQTHHNNTHESWQFYGRQVPGGGGLTLMFPPPPAESDAQLDEDYFTDDITFFGDPPFTYTLPRLTVNGVPYVNTKPLSNNLRFHNCTFVGAIVADKPMNYTHVRNKIQFTGATKFVEKHPEFPDDPAYNPKAADKDEIAKSSMLLPHYSVDIGENNASPDQNVNLKGVIIAGVLDIRGNTQIDGALLLTFEPTQDDPALQHYGVPVGNPANFNTTLGYFGPDEGDEEGFTIFEHNGQLIVGFDTTGDGYPDTSTYEDGAVPVPFNGYGRIVVNWDPDLIMPDGLIAPIRIEPVRASYREGRLSLGDY
ncbi:MAG: hypothetical protein EA376_08510 [Phycisphaeraceae bacterium]|nr:MAG: hypothetical protein EA376_08510 [Phycisphaeraceae bacterium]